MTKTQTTECPHCKKILTVTAIKRHIRIYHETVSNIIIRTGICAVR